MAVSACESRNADPAPAETAVAAVAGRSTEDSVRVLEQMWADAVRSRDSTALERLVAPDFTVSGADAKRPPVPRATWMTNTMQKLRVDSIRLGEVQVATRGDTAVATLNYVWAGQFMKMPKFRDSTIVTDTWIRRADGWSVQRRVLAE
jgi:ketosteroid isomerase-like protein